MKDTSTRVFGLMCVLVGVWTAVYWLYEPGEPPVTFAQSPSGRDSAATPASRGPMAEVIPPLGTPDRTPVPPSPAPTRQPPAVPTRPTPAADAPKTRVVPPQYWEYTVQKGDGSMEAIARRLLGDDRLWTKIAEANPLLDARKLIPGRTVLKIPKDLTNIQGKEIPIIDPVAATPPGAESPPATPPSTPPATPPASTTHEYVVQSGDTLSDIAKAVYGKSALWRRIYEANKDVIADPDAVKPGTKLRIPPND